MYEGNKSCRQFCPAQCIGSVWLICLTSLSEERTWAVVTSIDWSCLCLLNTAATCPGIFTVLEDFYILILDCQFASQAEVRHGSVEEYFSGLPDTAPPVHTSNFIVLLSPSFSPSPLTNNGMDYGQNENISGFTSFRNSQAVGMESNAVIPNNIWSLSGEIPPIKYWVSDIKQMTRDHGKYWTPHVYIHIDQSLTRQVLE